jgi:hypothetical protein
MGKNKTKTKNKGGQIMISKEGGGYCFNFIVAGVGQERMWRERESSDLELALKYVKWDGY